MSREGETMTAMPAEHNPAQTRADPWAAAGVYQHQAKLDAVINDTDKVYRNTETGRFIKVRAKRRAPAPPPPGQPRQDFGEVIVELSAAHCTEDGRAIRRADAPEDLSEADAFQIAPTQAHTFKSSEGAAAAYDFAAALEAKRIIVAAGAERAVELEASAQTLPR